MFFKRKKILVVGAFERDNFGDILFYLVLEKYAKRFCYRTTPSSIVSTDMEKYFSRQVVSYNEALLRDKWSAIWVAGGEVGGCDVPSALRMTLDTDSFKKFEKRAEKDSDNSIFQTTGLKKNQLAYLPNLSLYPKNFHAPLIVNSVGGFERLEDASESFKKEVLSILSSSVLVVRNQETQKYLKTAGVKSGLAPDVVHALSRVYEPRKINEEYILFQADQSFIYSNGVNEIARMIVRLGERFDKKIYLFSAGTAAFHDDIELYEKIVKSIKNINPKVKIGIIREDKTFSRVDWIANADLWIGTSLHGRIVSASYAVPRVSLNRDKLNRYCKLWDKDFPFGTNISDLESQCEEAFRLAKKNHISKSEKLANLAEENLLNLIENIQEANRKRLKQKFEKFAKYISSITHPRIFLGMTVYYLKKLVKNYLPRPIVKFLRTVYVFLREFKHDLALSLIKRKMKHDSKDVKISVAIPIYDRTDELREAIESILHQSYQAFELLLITDGSPKETLEVVYSYKDHPKVRIFDYKDNSGNSVRGRNKAILEARGKYLAFLDSDDIALPNRLFDTVATFERTKADVVYGGFEFMLSGGRKIEGVEDGQRIMPQSFSFEELLKANYLFNSATAVRTDVVRKVGGLKTEMSYCEDYELWLRMMNAGAKFAPLGKVVIKYRIHGGNLELVFKENEKKWIEMAQSEYKNLPKLPIKVGYVLPTTGIGGGPSVICEHANRLMKRGYDVNIIVDPQHKDEYDLSWFPGQAVPIIKSSQAYGCYDVLIATGWTTAFTLKTIDAKRRIYFVQSDETRFTDSHAIREKIRKTYRMNYEFMTEAKWIQKWLKDEFGKDAFLVPNAVNEKVFYPDEPLEKKRKKLRVLLEGPIDIPFKGLKEAFETINELDCEVWCVSSLGKPKTGWRYDKFFEKVPQSKMRSIYSSCDVILKLSRVEGFFGPPLEMMACGGTAVVGDVTGYDEYIVDGQNALVVKLGDLKAAKKAIQRLIDDRKLLEKLKEGGRRTADRMNWEKSVDLLEDIINEKSHAQKG